MHHPWSCLPSAPSALAALVAAQAWAQPCLAQAGCTVPHWAPVTHAWAPWPPHLPASSLPLLPPRPVQYLLTGLKFHPIEALNYLAPACGVWLSMGAIIVEFPKARAAPAGRATNVQACSGCFGCSTANRPARLPACLPAHLQLWPSMLLRRYTRMGH